MHEGCFYKYPPLPIARYSFIQLIELEQCRETTCPRFDTVAQDSNPGSRSRESEALATGPLRFKITSYSLYPYTSFVEENDFSKHNLYLYTLYTVESSTRTLLRYATVPHGQVRRGQRDNVVVLGFWSRVNYQNFDVFDRNYSQLTALVSSRPDYMLR